MNELNKVYQPKNEVGRATPAPPQGGSGIMIVSESASATKEIKDMLSDMKESLGYMTKLLESLVNHLDLSHRRKTDQLEIFKLYNQMIPMLFAGKEFKGKEQFLELLEKISKIGSE